MMMWEQMVWAYMMRDIRVADTDGSEGNGRPEQGEPNFGIFDKDESDQLGLTGFLIYPVHRYELQNDEENWQVLSSLPSPHGSSLRECKFSQLFFQLPVSFERTQYLRA